MTDDDNELSHALRLRPSELCRWGFTIDFVTKFCYWYRPMYLDSNSWKGERL